MTIDFNQILPQYTPDVQVELDREGGLSGLPRDQKKVLLVGYQTSAATAVAGAVKRITSVSYAKAQWGEGSMLACMAQAALDVSSKIPLYGVSFAENESGVPAAGTITITGTASGSGSLELWIAGRYFQIGIASTDTVEIVVDKIIAKIAQYDNLPFTLTKGAGTAFVIAVAARNDGPEGNTILIRSRITAGITTACAVGAMASGATAGDPTSVLTGVEGDRYHIVCIGTNDATTIGKVVDHCEKQSAPFVQKWCIGVAGFTGTRGDADTLANALDSYNCQVVWHQKSEIPVFELAARFAALRATKAANVGVIDTELKGVAPAYDETKWPTSADIEAAIEAGITPIRPLRNGTCQVVRSVLTRQSAPISYRDHNVEEIWHYVCEYLLNVFSARVKGKRLKSASPPGRPDTVTPGRATAILNECLFALDRLDYLQGVKDSIAAGNNFAEVNAVEPTTRLDAAFDFIPVGIAVFTAIKGTLKAPLV